MGHQWAWKTATSLATKSGDITNLQTRGGAVTLICHIITFVGHDADTSATAMHINARMFGELTEALWGNCQGPLELTQIYFP